MLNDLIYPIAKIEHVKKRVDELQSRSDDIKGRVGHTLKKLWNPERVLRAVPDGVDLDSLRSRFPQFNDVIDFYENSIVSLSRLDLPFEIQPILLQGDPGLGKTYFASELAKCIQLPFFEFSLATTSASFGLCGGNLQWAESSPGFIANTLATSEVANPIILIDEIDKGSAEGRYKPMNVLYSLLESHSSAFFKDEALEFPLDASKIVWLATSNYLNNVPAPIQSRMRVFEIHQPDISVMPTVIKSIYEHIRVKKTYGKLLDPVIDETLIDCLSNRSPRAVKLALEEAAFKAIRHYRSAIYVTDLPVAGKEKYRVGFI